MVHVDAPQEPRERYVGRNVAAELRRQGLTQGELVQRLAKGKPALTDTQLSRRIRGESRFSAGELDAVARALGVRADDLLRASPRDAGPPTTPPSSGDQPHRNVS